LLLLALRFHEAGCCRHCQAAAGCLTLLRCQSFSQDDFLSSLLAATLTRAAIADSWPRAMPLFIARLFCHSAHTPVMMSLFEPLC